MRSAPCAPGPRCAGDGDRAGPSPHHATRRRPRRAGGRASSPSRQTVDGGAVGGVVRGRRAGRGDVARRCRGRRRRRSLRWRRWPRSSSAMTALGRSPARSGPVGEARPGRDRTGRAVPNRAAGRYGRSCRRDDCSAWWERSCCPDRLRGRRGFGRRRRPPGGGTTTSTTSTTSIAAPTHADDATPGPRRAHRRLPPTGWAPASPRRCTPAAHPARARPAPAAHRRRPPWPTRRSTPVQAVPADVVARSTWQEGCPVTLDELRYVGVVLGFRRRGPHRRADRAP